MLFLKHFAYQGPVIQSYNRLMYNPLVMIRLLTGMIFSGGTNQTTSQGYGDYNAVEEENQHLTENLRSKVSVLKTVGRPAMYLQVFYCSVYNISNTYLLKMIILSLILLSTSVKFSHTGRLVKKNQLCYHQVL